ncbi:MAG TPA: hypothetical protein VJ719_10625, partial [Chthoniobacterales bacterium]|nr:hypothetical protein [Chthoniobacterales bacterium]
MSRKSFDQAGFISLRHLTAVALCSLGGLMALLGFSGVPWKDSVAGSTQNTAEKRERYMPVAGEKGEDLNRLEAEWHNRVTYPTGRFDPAWVRAAAAKDELVQRRLPAGVPPIGVIKRGPAGTSSPAAATALDPTRFTALGPQPLRMTGCSGCYDYTRTAGRVND